MKKIDTIINQYDQIYSESKQFDNIITEAEEKDNDTKKKRPSVVISLLKLVIKLCKYIIDLIKKIFDRLKKIFDSAKAQLLEDNVKKAESKSDKLKKNLKDKLNDTKEKVHQMSNDLCQGFIDGFNSTTNESTTLLENGPIRTMKLIPNKDDPDLLKFLYIDVQNESLEPISAGITTIINNCDHGDDKQLCKDIANKCKIDITSSDWQSNPQPKISYEIIENYGYMDNVAKAVSKLNSYNYVVTGAMSKISEFSTESRNKANDILHKCETENDSMDDTEYYVTRAKADGYMFTMRYCNNYCISLEKVLIPISKCIQIDTKIVNGAIDAINNLEKEDYTNESYVDGMLNRYQAIL